MGNDHLNIQLQVSRLVLAAVFIMTLYTSASAEPLKVYIMTGQSNMQGKARPSTLPAMEKDPQSNALHDKLVDENGKPRVYEDVYLANMVKGEVGPLSLAKGDESGKMKGTFGPEVAFGITMQEHVDEPILIVKIAWGGKSLHTDFRPPSAGPVQLAPEIVKIHKEKDLEERTKRKITEMRNNRGKHYEKMMKHVKTTLGDPGKYHPEYDPQEGYELSGIVWFQGYNDKIAGWVYASRRGKDGYKKYSRLLTKFINDVRKDLEHPKLPFLIGVLGMGGKKSPDTLTGAFQNAMAAPAENSQLENVLAVHTGTYWDQKLDELNDRMRSIRKKVKRKRKKQGKKEARTLKKKLINDQFTDQELKYLKTGKSNGGYHYYGSAKIYSRIGEAFAEALIKGG